MKLVAKPIDVVAVFIAREKPRPYRIRYKDQYGENQIIKIDKVISIEEHQVPGIHGYIYQCQSTRDCDVYRYELLYKPDTSSWLLYKI